MPNLLSLLPVALICYVHSFNFRSDKELIGHNNQYLSKIVAIFAEVQPFTNSSF